MNAKSEFFKGLSDDEAARILALGDRLTLTSGAELFHMGQRAEYMYLVTRGRIKLTMPMLVRGKEQDVLVEERSAGETLGWSALIPPNRFTLTATAMIQSEVIALGGETLRDHFFECPQVGNVAILNLAEVIGQRLQLLQAMWMREMERMVEMRCA